MRINIMDRLTCIPVSRRGTPQRAREDGTVCSNDSGTMHRLPTVI